MNTLKIFLLAVIITSCGSDEPGSTGGSGASGGSGGSGGTNGWLIPADLVFDGGPGKDGIPALIDPDMKNIGDAGLDYLDDDDLMIVFKSQNDVKAYSHKILDWHEIINDDIQVSQNTPA